MRNHEHRRPVRAVHGLEALEQKPRILGIKRTRGLVGHDDGRVGNQGARRGNTLLLATRKLIGVLVQRLTDAEAPGDLGHASERLFGRHAADSERQGNVLSRGKRIEKIGILEDEPQLLAAELGELLALKPRDVFTVHDHAAARDLIDGRDAIEQRRLARAGCTHDAHEVALVDGKGDIAQRMRHVAAATIDLFNMLNVEHGGTGDSGGARRMARLLGKYRHLRSFQSFFHYGALVADLAPMLATARRVVATPSPARGGDAPQGSTELLRPPPRETLAPGVCEPHVKRQHPVNANRC